MQQQAQLSQATCVHWAFRVPVTTDTAESRPIHMLYDPCKAFRIILFPKHDAAPRDPVPTFLIQILRE